MDKYRFKQLLESTMGNVKPLITENENKSLINNLLTSDFDFTNDGEDEVDNFIRYRFSKKLGDKTLQILHITGDENSPFSNVIAVAAFLDDEKITSKISPDGGDFVDIPAGEFKTKGKEFIQKAVDYAESNSEGEDESEGEKEDGFEKQMSYGDLKFEENTREDIRLYTNHNSARVVFALIKKDGDEYYGRAGYEINFEGTNDFLMVTNDYRGTGMTSDGWVKMVRGYDDPEFYKEFVERSFKLADLKLQYLSQKLKM